MTPKWCAPQTGISNVTGVTIMIRFVIYLRLSEMAGRTRRAARVTRPNNSHRGTHSATARRVLDTEGYQERWSLSVSRSPSERAAIGGHARAAKLSPKQRKESSSHAHLASVVAQVVARAPDLSPEQVAKLRAIFAPVSKEAVQK